MEGQVVHLRTPKSAEEIADEETKLKEKMLKWVDDIAGKVIAAAREDAGLPFLDNTSLGSGLIKSTMRARRRGRRRPGSCAPVCRIVWRCA